jgi:prolyl oligopeptidase
VSCASVKQNSTQDPYLWLEEIESPKALEFAKLENEKTFSVLKNDSHFKNIEKEIREIVLAKDRVPWVGQTKGELYNFWKDEANPKGLWRKTTLKSYKTDKPNWDILFNLDDLAKKENENWVWKGSACLRPKYEKCLIYLSRGGKDATVIREYDLKTKSFVKDGFNIPEAKSSAHWIDENAIYLGTDYGANSLTDSGYPRIIKVLQRGQKLSEAKTVFEVNSKDMSAHAYVLYDQNKPYQFYSRTISFYENEIWYVHEGKQFKIPMPVNSKFASFFKGNFLFELRSGLKNSKKSFKAGSLVSLTLESVLHPESFLEKLQLVFEPTDKKFLESTSRTKNYVLLEVLDNIKGKIIKVTLSKKNKWKLSNIDLGNNGVASISSTEVEHDNFLASYTDFITPDTLYYANASKNKINFEKLKTAPQRFNASDVVSEQKYSISKDGTKIPYFIIHQKSMKYNGKNPTLLYGYGGFELSKLPSYLSSIGKAWVEKGGVYVLANIRGGGEFGRAWHEATVKEKHQNAFDDFISIAEDLIKTQVTTPAHLGIQGGSNGGLLTGATFVQRPDLFNAVICEVPLLDMLRFNKLLAGASWMDEYGNPDDPKDREYILKYSPYHNVKSGIKYPEVFFLTNTKDDRVHPGHARKMVAKMRAQGHPVFYFENIEGGHGGAASLEQIIFRTALNFTYLWKKLSL